MNENLTEIAFILDRSGSMECQCSAAIDGFNNFLKEQKGVPGEAHGTLILFDHEYIAVAEGVSLAEIEPLNQETYVPRGMTALLDAMGRTIDTLGQRLAATPEAERPNHVIVVTLTDGLENSSSQYTAAQIASMIRHQEEKYAWEFIFLAASLEGVQEGKSLGVHSSIKYCMVEEGMALSSQMVMDSRRKRVRQPHGEE